MDNQTNIVKVVTPEQRMADKAERENWEPDDDTVEMDFADMSSIADGFNMIKKGMELISNATGVDIDSV